MNALRTWTRTPGFGVWLALAGLTLVYAALVISRASSESFFTLDDPYIHLAMAENIAHGHFGVNTGEVSNPSSSILWPWLLAGLSPLGVWGPLLVNIASFLATAWLLIGFARRHLAETRKAFNALVVTALAFFSINIFGVIFTGLEHSLHVLVSLFGIIRTLDRRYDRALLAALVLSPLVRFEGFAVLAFGLGAALADRRWRFAALAAATVAAIATAYAAWLTALGLPVLPTSVLVKSDPTGVWSGGASAAVQAVAGNLAKNLARQETLLAAAVLALAIWLRGGRERTTAIGLLILLGLGLAFGPMGGFPRYEVYLLACVMAGALYLFRRELRTVTRSFVISLSLGVVLVAVNFSFGLFSLGNTPQAARNIFQQQYQMHRFVTACWKKPVAVNDLGWVSYRNEAYVLDLWGLANEEARIAQAAGEPGWMDTLTQKHNVEAALIYSDWFPDVPASWIKVGELHIIEPSLSPARPVVDVYATRAPAATEIARCLEELKADLPRGVEVRLR